MPPLLRYMHTEPTGWTHHLPVRIVFEHGAFDRVAEHCQADRVVLVTTPGFRRRGHADRVAAAMGSKLVAVLDDVAPNPDISRIDAQCTNTRPKRPEMLVAMGGGSAMDTVKALARLLPQPPDHSLTAHFRDGRAFEPVPALPIATIPTTAGTGAEVTPFATVWDFERYRKHSVFGQDLFPRHALVDPRLTLGLPEDVTIASGLDAISHAFESIWNNAATPVSIGFATRSLQLALPVLAQLNTRPSDPQARNDMMQASLLAGMAISQTRTALAHSISYPLTAIYGVPHGLACSFTLPALLAFNHSADDGRLDNLSHALGFERVDRMRDAVDTLLSDLGAGELISKYVTHPADILSMTDQMITPSRSGNNLRPALQKDIEEIIVRSLDSLRI